MLRRSKQYVNMVTDTKQKKTLKLANWQVFVQEKLHQLYAKGTLCDVTLKFSDNDTIQAHKVVLMACTTFFDLLPNSSTNVVLQMPKTMQSQYVKPIINFMYCGKLEYSPEDLSSIAFAAKAMGMSVLSEILQKQEISSFAKKPDSQTTVKHSIPSQDKIPDSEDTKSAPTEDTTVTGALPGKRLPIWKKRMTKFQFQPQLESFNPANKKLPAPQNTVVEAARPTRFDWPEDESLPEVNLTQSSVDSFLNISYDSKIIVKPVNNPKPVILEDPPEIMAVSPSVIHGGCKRVRDSRVIRDHCEDDDYANYESPHELDDEYEVEVLTPKTCPKLTKPIIKNHELSTPTPSKRVKFTLSSDKTSDSKSTSSSVATPTNVPPVSTTATVGSGPMQIEHAKIINEILSKYPEMVKNNKNIKLKIHSEINSQPSTEVDKDGKVQKKVQYVFLKSDITSEKKESTTESVGAENRNGPWLCVSCGNESGPINFDTYFKYRKHLQEVHNEKIDARICEHCGFKASKRNLHLYHLYTKHNISPPRNIHFPKCDQCNYIALSESLLMKHRSNHTGVSSKDYTCHLCMATFKNYGALMAHKQTKLHCTDQISKRHYACEFCGKVFNRNINLKAHIRTSHQDESRKTYEDEDRIVGSLDGCTAIVNQDEMDVIEVPVFESIPDNNKTIYLQPGMTILAESPAVPLMPSSESEALNNVATGIATSINLTNRTIPNDVIVIDGNSEIIIRGAPAYVLNQDGSYSVQEYIVPEIINEPGQVYTALVNTAPAASISYLSTDNISLVTSNSDHTYADGMKINGHVTTIPQGPTVITTQSSQPITTSLSQPIIVQDPILVSADWMQSLASSQPDVTASTSVDSAVQTSETAQTLVSDWGDLEEESQDLEADDESEMKPSRPTIDALPEIDM